MSEKDQQQTQKPTANNPEGLSQNPMYNGLNVNLKIPETIDITMVEAKSLGDFELWSFLVSLMSNFVVGFVVAWLSAPESTTSNPSFKPIYGKISLCFILLFVVFGIILGFKIWQMHQSKKTIKTKLSVDANEPVR